MNGQNIPPPPPGFQLQGQAGLPPPPPGFVVSEQPQQDAAAEQAPQWSPEEQRVAKQMHDRAMQLVQNDPSILDRVLGSVKEMGQAEAHHLGNLPLGLAQLVGHGINAAGKALPADSGIRQSIEGTTRNFDQYLRNREDQYQASVPDSAASYGGAAVGEILPWIVGLGGLRAAGLLPKASTALQKGAALATEGAATAVPQPVLDGEDYASNKAKQIGIGAGLAAGSGALGKAISAGARGVRDTARLASDAGREKLANQRLAKTLAAVDPDAAAKLNQAAPLIPGESVGAGQAIGGPRAVQMTRQFMNDADAAPVMADAANANDSARMRVLQKLAGTDEQLEAARQARRDATEPYISENLRPSTPATRWTQAAAPLDDLLGRNVRMSSSDHDALLQARKIVGAVRGGSMQEDDAIRALSELEEGMTSKTARNVMQQVFDASESGMIDPGKILTNIAKMRNTGPGARVRVREALDKIANTIKESQNTRGMVPMDVMDSIRQNINDFLVSPAGKRASAQEARHLDPVRNQIIQALQQRAPGYSDYLATYAEKSAPINTMERIRDFIGENTAGGDNSAGGKVLSPSALKRFLRQDDAARYKLSPDARRQIEAVRDSARRDALPNVKVGTKGSDTAANLKLPSLAGSLTPMKTRMLGASLGALLEHGLGLPGGGWTGGSAGFVGGAMLDPLLKGANADVVRRMAGKLVDSQEAARALNEARVAPAGLERLLQNALPYQSVPSSRLQALSGS